MTLPQIAGETALAAGKLLRASKIAMSVTNPSQGRGALREIATILQGIPGQESLTSQLSAGADILDDNQVLQLCRQMASTFASQARMLSETAVAVMDVNRAPKKKWWQFWK